MLANNPATNESTPGPGQDEKGGITEKDPVDVISGAVVHDVTDIAIPCPGFDLVLSRHYDSRLNRILWPVAGDPFLPTSRVDGPFGPRWVHSLDPRLVATVNDTVFGQYGHWLVFSPGDGSLVWFLLSSSTDPYLDPLPPGPHGLRPIRPRLAVQPPANLPAWTDDPVYRLSWDAAAGQWRVSTPGKNVATFDEYGLVRSLSNSAGQSLTFNRNGLLLTSVVHSFGQRIDFEHDAQGRIRRAYVPGTTFQVEYAYSALATPNGGLSGDGAGGDLVRVKRSSSAGTSWRSYSYLSDGHDMTLYSHAARDPDVGQDPAAHQVYYTYTNLPPLRSGDPQRRLAVTSHVGAQRRYEGIFDFTQHGRTVVRSPRDGSSSDTVYRYSATTRQPTAIEHPVGETNTLAYATRLPVALVTSGHGNVAGASINWNVDLQPERIETGYNVPAGESGAVWQLDWDSVCRLPTGVTDPCGRRSGADYDAAARAITNWVELAPGQRLAEQLDYGGNGLLSTWQDAAGRSVAFSYGPGGYVTNVTPAVGPGASYRWHSGLGILTNVTLPGPSGSRTFAMARDELGRTRRLTLPGGHGSASFDYSIFGYLTNAVDTAGRVTRQTWHATGQFASHSRQADNGQWATVSFDYDQQMDTLRIRDPLNREVERYALDAIGRATNVWDIENRRMAVRYALGELVSGIDRFDGSSVSYSYDTGARLTRARYPDGDLQFGYLACGRPVLASNAASRIAWAHDGAGRLTNETTVTALGTSSLSWQLDPSGLATNTQLSVERCALSVERSFDPAARLSTQATEAGAFAWGYTPWNGLPAAVTNLDTGLRVEYAYDVLDRVTNIHWRAAGGTTLRRFAYTFDRAGCITNVLAEGEALAARNTVYTYDALDRLIAQTTPGRTNTWRYDLAGNRTNASHNGASIAYTLGVGDRLAATSDGGAYLYNAAGCVTNISSGGSTVVSLTWNAQYQLTSVLTNGALAESYTYDALGRRVSTTAGGSTTYHVYDGNWQVLADLDASGHPLRTYTWAPGIDQLLAITVYSNSLTVLQSHSLTVFPLTDHLGTVHALVDDAGAVVESYEFDAWGSVQAVRDANGDLLTDDRGRPFSTLGNRYLFQGREYAWSTGLYHFRHRWYEPVTGRWLSNDPIGTSGGLNQYGAFEESPTTFKDPEGNFALVPVVVAGVLGAANLVVWTEVYKVNFGHHYADTLTGTDITFRGITYFRLSPVAREVIDAHESVHSGQSYWDSDCKKERAAYVVQYLSAMRLLRLYHRHTREHQDLSRLRHEAWLYLATEGGYTPEQLRGMKTRAESRFARGSSNGPPQ